MIKSSDYGNGREGTGSDEKGQERINKDNLLHVAGSRFMVLSVRQDVQPTDGRINRSISETGVSTALSTRQ